MEDHLLSDDSLEESGDERVAENAVQKRRKSSGKMPVKRRSVQPSEIQLKARGMPVEEVANMVKDDTFVLRAESFGSRKGAPFWDTMRRVVDKESEDRLDFVCCSRCKQVWKHDRTVNTDALHRHVSKCGVKANQPKITGYLKSHKLPLAAKQEKSRVCARYCAVDGRNFEEVVGTGFRALIDTVIDVTMKYSHAGKPTARDMLPDPTSVSQYVGKEAKAIRESLLEEVKPILRLRGGGITLDFWEEEYTKVSYLGCTVPYMFGGSELRERLLFCSECDTVDRKTGAAVQKFIFSKLREIGLCEEDLKLCSFVTDQGGNMKVAFRNSGFERINCAGHLLNTCSQNFLKSNPKSQHPMPAEALPVLALVNQVKSLVTHCKQGGISRQLKTTLKQHCETRWNTHVEMFASVLAVYEQLEDILAERKESHLLPSRQKMQEFHDLFEPVRDATFLLSVSKRPTIHLVVPAYLELKRHFKDQVPSDFPEIRAFQKHVENIFNKELQIDELHRVAVFLDPSMKHLQFLTATERVAVLKRAMEEVQKIPQPEKTGAPIVEVASRGSTKFNVKALAKYSADNPIGNEVERYASLPSPPEDQDVLSFWTEKENDFPRLKCYALRILSVSATSTPSERLFSRSGTAVSEKRKNLAPQTLSDLMVVQSNFEFENV
ncbi:hypothetical protein RvY_00297 [Ramazzottius varieornatus]|uniref:HAT C-terminal dimerisation domain-containing protein n=1 Tax=Ramazzottius varieornatus TaxID=947166 RepID=A0A1D1UIM2_RAMVA|nr:hypothetical protein RvY_00297 [Ramazzottius varieornatus]